MRAFLKGKTIFRIVLKTFVFALIFTNAISVGQTSKKPPSDLLPFVPELAESVSQVRPSRIVGTADFAEFKAAAGPDADKTINRLTNQYFKFGLADFENLETIVYADWTHKSKNNAMRYHSIMLLNTVDENSDQFDLATHAVKQEIEYKDKTILCLKKALDRYKFACILDEKTIAWSRHMESIKTAIDSGTEGAADANWYSLWAPLAEKPFCVMMQLDEDSFKQTRIADLKELKGIQFVVAGIDVAKDAKLIGTVACESNQKANQLVDIAKQFVNKYESSLLSKIKLEPANAKGLTLVQNFLKSLKFKQTRNLTRVTGGTRLDFKALVEPMNQIYEAQGRAYSANNVRQNALAFHNFESAFGHFPQSVFVHESGKKYSWRIAILPFMGRSDIYDKYDFTQDWDSPHNLEVTSQMPDFFRSDMDDTDSTNTSFFLLSGPGGMFGSDEPFSFSQLTDGSSNTIMAIQAQRDVHWAKPEDIYIDPNQPLPDFGGYHKGGFNVAYADGSVHFLPEKVAEQYLRNLFSPNDGTVIPVEIPLDEEEPERDK